MAVCASGIATSIHYNTDMQADREPDAQLIDASRRGDHAAFAQIVERYQRGVYAVSLSQLGDRTLCDDITQDTFVTAWRQLGELRDPARLPAWLCGIARNLARDARKRRRFEAAARELEMTADGTPFDALSNAESDRLLAVALAAIPEKYREPLVLFYYEQRSADDVARMLGISAATAHQRLSRGRKYLANRMVDLVEHGLSRRGPNRELVAGVLAAIAMFAPASHVDACPAAKGSTMLHKLTVTAIMIVTVATVAVSAGVTTAPATRTTPNPSAASHPTGSAAKPRKPVPPSPTAPTAPSPGARVAPRLPAPAAITVPDCEAVAKYMSGLAIASLDKPGPVNLKKRAMVSEFFTRAIRQRCKEERWSENVRLCMTEADDYERARIECSDEQPATRDEIAALPPELRCDALARHFYLLANAPGGKYTLMKGKLTAKDADGVAKIDESAVKTRDALSVECEQRPWSVEHRRCVATSATFDAYARCR